MSSCTPLSTTRAAARSGGGVCSRRRQRAGWRLSRPSVPVSRRSRAPARRNHPTSSCSWRWCGVLVVPSSPSSPPSPCLPPAAVPLTWHPFPPHEQLLVAVVGGASWGRCRRLPFPSPALPLVSPPHRRSTHQPPHEQLLVRLGWVVCRCSSPYSPPPFVVAAAARSSSLSFHPRSTPRAVAREAGGGWCVVRWGPICVVSCTKT